VTVGRCLVLAALGLLIGAAPGRRNSRLWVKLTVGGMAAALAAALLVRTGRFPFARAGWSGFLTRSWSARWCLRAMR